MNILETRIQSICRRNRLKEIYGSVSFGLFFAGILLVLFFGVHLIAHWTIDLPLTFIALGMATGMIGGLVIGLLTPIDRLESARAIDRHYRLKDRVLTASKISLKSEHTTMEGLQIVDAIRHTESVEPAKVVPYSPLPGLYRVAALYLVVFGMGIYVMFIAPATNLAAIVPNEDVLSILEQLKERLADPMKDLARANPDDEVIQKLNDRVGELMERLNAQHSDPQEALLTLNRMEKEILEAMRLFDLEAMDASLKELGEALTLSEATRPAAELLLSGDYQKAAEQLENTDFSAMSGRERQMVGNELETVADAMERRKQMELAQMAQKLAEDIKRGNCEGCKNTACKFADICRKQCARKGACNNLNCKLATLGLCKSQCLRACATCPNRDQCASQVSTGGESGQMPGGVSDTGTANTGLSLAEETGELDSHRELQQIAGISGTGQSETNISRTLNASEDNSALEYEKKLVEYKKQAEAILETEPIPFEHRQLIQRYFESIVPGTP